MAEDTSWEENAEAIESRNLLVRLRKIAAQTGMTQPPLSKNNEFRARWILQKINSRHANNEYWQSQYRAIPDFIRADIEGNVIGR